MLAPDLLPTVTRDDRRAAQNAARIAGDGDPQLESAQALALWVMQSLLRLVAMYFLGPGSPNRAPTTAFCRGAPRGVSSSTIKGSREGAIVPLLVGVARVRDC